MLRAFPGLPLESTAENPQIPSFKAFGASRAFPEVFPFQYGWECLVLQKWFQRGPLRADHGIPSNTEGISEITNPYSEPSPTVLRSNPSHTRNERLKTVPNLHSNREMCCLFPWGLKEEARQNGQASNVELYAVFGQWLGISDCMDCNFRLVRLGFGGSSNLGLSGVELQLNSQAFSSCHHLGLCLAHRSIFMT